VGKRHDSRGSAGSLGSIQGVCIEKEVQPVDSNGLCNNVLLSKLPKVQQENSAINSSTILEGSRGRCSPPRLQIADNTNVPNGSSCVGCQHPPKSGSGNLLRSSQTRRPTSSYPPKTTTSSTPLHNHLHHVEDELKIRRSSSTQFESNSDQIKSRNHHRLVQQDENNSNELPSSRHLDQPGGNGRISPNSSRSAAKSSSSHDAVHLQHDMVRQVAQDSASSSRQLHRSQCKGRSSDSVRPHGGIRSHQQPHNLSHGQAQSRPSRSSLVHNSSLHPRSNNKGSSQSISHCNEIDAVGSRRSVSSQLQQQQQKQSSLQQRPGRRVGRRHPRHAGLGERRRPTRTLRLDDDEKSNVDGNNKNNNINNLKHSEDHRYNNKNNNTKNQLSDASNNNSNNTNINKTSSSFRGASVKFRRHQTKVADQQQLENDVYHSKNVKKYNKEELLRRANSKTRRRFLEVVHDIERPFGDDIDEISHVEVPISKSAKQHHTVQRLRDGNIRKVSPADENRYPSLGIVDEFCVVEQKKHPVTNNIFDRLRQIDHPVKQNKALRSKNFTTTAPLRHFSHYHRRISHKMALIADLEASFYGFELDDPVARSFYRFRDETGQLYELTVLMMGLVASVELQQIITSIIAGHEDYVLPKFASPTLPEIWVDNIRYCGDEKILKKCKKFLEETMVACNASLEIEAISAEYDFLGATWNHNNKTVQLAKKTLQKLPSSIPSSMNAHDLEGVIGRLIFAAQIQQDPLVNHYWLLKWARRFFNGMNSGRISPDQEISIPPSAASSLSKWLEGAKKPHRIRFSNNSTNTATLFTDASLFGWGAVLILADGSIHIAGGKFTSKDHNNNINIAESIALEKSLFSFSSLISSLSLSRLDIFVDNTSVEYNVRRGMPRADDLAAYVKNIWNKIFSLNISVTLNRVPTKMNPADAISRGKKLQFSILKQALGELTTNDSSNKRSGLEERHILVS